jgi:hypothetical protein
VKDETIICRGLRLCLLLKGIFMFGVFPFITYLALYQVNLVNNIFIIVTVPNMLQFSFGVLSACYTDIIPIFQNVKDLHPMMLALRTVLLLLPVFLIFGMSVIAGMMWTDTAPVSYTDTNGTFVPRSTTANGALTTFTVLGTTLFAYFVIATCSLASAFSSQIGDMGTYMYETATGLNSKAKALKESAEAKLGARGQLVEGDWDAVDAA